MDIKRYLEQAEIYYNTKNYDKAEEYLKKVIEIDPKCKEGYRKLAEIYEEKKEYEKAINYYKNLVELDPDDMDNYLKITELEKNIEYKISEEKEIKREIEDEDLKNKTDKISIENEQNMKKASSENITISKNKLFLIIAFVALGGLIIFGINENNKRHHNVSISSHETPINVDHSNTMEYDDLKVDNNEENKEEENKEYVSKRGKTSDGLEYIDYGNGEKEYIKYVGEIPKDKYGKCFFRFVYVDNITDKKGRNITIYKAKSTAQCDEESIYLRYYYPELNKNNPLKEFEKYDDPDIGMWLDEPIEKKREDIYTSYTAGLKDGSRKRNIELEKELEKHNLYCSPKNDNSGNIKEKEPTEAELSRGERDAMREEILENLRKLERAKGKKVRETTSYNPTDEEAEKVENYMRTGSFEGE